MSDWQPLGTVYGTLLNFQREWDLWAPRMTQDPHKGPPQAPVLYVKTANTFSPAGQGLLLQDGVTEVDIGTTLGLVIGQDAQVAGAALLCDWSVPHASYYRPPVKFRCRDGFLGLPAQILPSAAAASWANLTIETRRNGDLVQTTRLGDLKRPVAQLLDDVGEFMTLQPGDVLMVGTDCLADGTRPRAKAGDRVEISAPGFASVTVQVGGAA
ncbi:fumarylacetoacetate hydrolase family protein [Limnohabitans sp. Jir72]|uniref:fumarylacetoacetate hydrolase family protein n=1 Tax=Limnohabitans sp. Jir72 TaxID=1977909 RepID=UPI000D3545D6|nr:fumarylacetoacetate hydrolase family protein [Limnohabitans sp. Jir72]PUE31862.1 fumarylacetoacetate hydrolase [Limnohabitans sp. Jir72]